MTGFGIYLAEIAIDVKNMLKACGGVVMLVAGISMFIVWCQGMDGDWRARETARFTCVTVLIGAALIILGVLFPTPDGARALFP